MEVLTTRRFEFSAAHRYWNPSWSPERNLEVFGKCTNEHGHGHNYVLEVTVAGEVDPDTGMVINLVDLKAIVGRVLEGFDHKHLNEDTPHFRDRQPTTENIVSVLWELIFGALPAVVRLAHLRLYETPDVFADYGGGPGAAFGRGYRFAAAHRLHSPALSPEENVATFGKCNNPAGHGHDYRFEVTVAGPVDAETGMVVNLADLDAAVAPLLEELDHTHLDRQQAHFAERPSTGENIVVYLWERLAAATGERLGWVRLWETPNNVFDYGGGA
ncbi:MAG: 6-pyruvoyl tetrahydropterin synthase [Acidimicrobiia bacterium]|nr:6-pyruvoyl tetrahydropterin synthase [Acidimicrobiia bacterium]